MGINNTVRVFHMSRPTWSSVADDECKICPLYAMRTQLYSESAMSVKYEDMVPILAGQYTIY